MTQRLHDFVKDRKTNVVSSKNDEYYLKLKDDRQKQQEMKELHYRIDRLEREIQLLKELIRSGRQFNNTTSS